MRILLLTGKIAPFVLFSIRGSSEGAALIREAGSRMHVLDWVEKPKEEFLASLNMLLTGTGASVCATDHWRPIGRHDASELRLTRADPSMVSAALAGTLRDWWLAIPRGANDPNWDLASTASFPDGRKGLVLIEAKAHVREFEGEAKGKPAGNPENHERIRQAIGEAAAGLRQHWLDIRISRDHWYQFSNRLAFAWKLASLGVPTVLIYLGFTSDDGMADCGDPLRDSDQWRSLVEGHLNPIFPRACWGREVQIAGTPMRVVIRSLPCTRQSPARAERRRNITPTVTRT